MRKYQRMTLAHRCQINAYLEIGISIPDMAGRLKFNKSSIYREIKRNFDFKTYNPHIANRLSRNRYNHCRKHYKISTETSTVIRHYLNLDWSPEQISGRLKLENKISLSHQSIYNYVYKFKELTGLLRRPKKRGFSRYSRKTLNSSNGNPIEQRPRVVEDRRRIGDWERDSFYVKDRKQLLVCAERKSRYIRMNKLTNGSSSVAGKLTEKLILELPRTAYTVTNDNGTEFKGEKIKIKTFFCNPRRPQERGTVENTIGLIRQYLKRNTDITNISDAEIQSIEYKLNHRPRKILNFRTPFEVFFNTKVALAI